MAFEEFKTERGNEINRIWNENKGKFKILLKDISSPLKP